VFASADGAYIIDLDEVQEGLARVNDCNEVYVINFEDINNCAAQNSKKIVKTFKESQGAMVLVDLVRNYHPLLFLKAWILTTVIFVRRVLNGGMSSDEQNAYWLLGACVSLCLCVSVSLCLCVSVSLCLSNQSKQYGMSWLSERSE